MIIRYCVLVLFSLVLSSCMSPVEMAMKENHVSLPDGMYRVERSGTKKTEILPLQNYEKIIVFNEIFLEKTDQDKEYLVVNVHEFAPLELAETPSTEIQEDKRKKLLLTLSDRAKSDLKEFTTKNLNAHTAIVVNNEALTQHKIKSVIEHGLLQITRCTDNACELLYSELKDNVIE